jgi:glyoxylase-like metal-dependent hydrolase (beta-lactamase superfamily II)
LIRFDLGEMRLTLLDAGAVWLDGGAMFGVVPKPLWERERAPDEKNRIQLSMNLLLIEDGKQRTLVDSGAGDKWDDKARAIYRLESRTPRAYLGDVGLAPQQIDCVISTHLHFDHAGGNTERDGEGTLRPTFPNAEYVVQSGELETARWDNERTRASYVGDDFEPLAAETGRLRLAEGDAVWTDRVRLRVAPGHTPAMQMVQIGTGGRTVCYLADLVPTTSHLRLPYLMGYDLEPLRTLETKRRVLREAFDEDWILIFEHDPVTPIGTLEEREGRLGARPWRPEA